VEASADAPVSYYLFDIVLLATGYDLRGVPLIQRKGVPPPRAETGWPLPYMQDHHLEEGRELFEGSRGKTKGLEGNRRQALSE